MRTARELIQQFPDAIEKGLTPDQVLESRRLFGSNRLTPAPRQPAWRKLLAKFNEPSRFCWQPHASPFSSPW
jgi:hypothetical protein